MKSNGSTDGDVDNDGRSGLLSKLYTSKQDVFFLSLIGDIYEEKKSCVLKGSLDSQETSRDESKLGRLEKGDQQGRLAKVPKISEIEEIPILC